MHGKKLSEMIMEQFKTYSAKVIVKNNKNIVNYCV